ncbi:MAG: LptF/LptG family permease [Elusimicrobiota bacterium]
MNILNRYILSKFIRPFIASFSALCVLIFVSQIFDRLDRFIADHVSLKHVLGYLLTSLPFQALQILPVACLLATLFVVGNLSRTKEYIAGLAGGIAPEKFLSGILFAGFFISILGVIANETIIPPATRHATMVYQNEIRRLGEGKQTIFKDLFVAGNDGRIWSTKILNQETGEMIRVVVDCYENKKLDFQVDAQSAKKTDAGWKFEKGAVRKFDAEGLKIISNENFIEKSFPFNEKPINFVIQEPQPEQMNSHELKSHIKRLSALGVPVRKLEVELLMKTAFPFACFIVTFLGIPLAMSGKGNRAIGIAAGLALTLFYLGFIQFGKALAQRVIPPWAGAWLGNIVFFSVALYLWLRMRKTA